MLLLSLTSVPSHLTFLPPFFVPLPNLCSLPSHLSSSVCFSSALTSVPSLLTFLPPFVIPLFNLSMFLQTHLSLLFRSLVCRDKVKYLFSAEFRRVGVLPQYGVGYLLVLIEVTNCIYLISYFKRAETFNECVVLTNTV